jgi:DNA-binding NarL/FixJ family response regulator
MSKRVFIVEDDEIYLEFLKKNLRAKYKIHAFLNAEDAYMALKSIKPEVLILDYGLPGMNGIELYEKVKLDLPADTKSIVLSSIDDGNLVLDFIKKGIRDYVIKDDNVIESLVSIIEESDDIFFDSGMS